MSLDGETTEEIEEALGHLCFAAKRKVPVVGNDEFPTAWDKAHKQINDLLSARDEAVAR